MCLKTLVAGIAAALCIFAASARAGTCTTGTASGGPPPKVDSDGWAMVNVCNTAGTTPGSPKYVKPGTVTYAGPNAAAIVTPNTAVTVFTAGSIASGCDIVNSVGNDTLYVDFTAAAVAGAATAFALAPGQSYHCPFPPTGAVSAVADKAQSFVAVRY